MPNLRERLICLGATVAIASSAAFIGSKEGVSLVPYADIGGVPTWCYGQTVGHKKARYTQQECDSDLLRSVRLYHQGVMLTMPSTAPQSVQAAFTSIAYHVGLSGWKHPRFAQPLAAGDWEAACRAITAPWKGKHGIAKGFKATVQGKPVRGLENRRAEEQKLCLQDLR